MPKKRIFVSCGQHTKEEKSFGKKIKELIEGLDMTAFFAETVHQAADLNTFLFKELQSCDGFVAVLQRRGEVHFERFDVTHRASVWIQQEIGILFYRSFLLERPIPMQIYMEDGIRHEGLTTMSIINPIPFNNTETVLKDLSAWLKGPTFEEQPVLARRESLFQRRIQSLTKEDWFLLEIIAAHTSEPGEAVIFNNAANDFYEFFRQQGKNNDQISSIFNQSRANLTSLGLVTEELIDNRQVRIFKIGKQWWDLLLEELRNQGRGF